MPSRTLYPHQWSWDSAFIAIGLRHLSAHRAQLELESLLAAQWQDGRVPHIVFNPAVPSGAYFPGPGFWRSTTAGRGPGAPRGRQTSGIVQPPVHALAAWLVHRADPDESRRRGFLQRVRPALEAWHRYLLTDRDLGGGGLAAVVHPWEPGLDNSPSWDGPLRRVKPAAADSFQRVDLLHGTAEDRPTDDDYARYVRLARSYRDHGYDDLRTPHAFAVEDPSFNALLIASCHALAHIAEETGADPGPPRRHAARLTRALIERLWDPASGLFLARDLHTGALTGGRSVAGLMPLLIPDLSAQVVAALLGTARGPHFRLGEVHLVPSYDLTAPQFDGSRYWRGPSWFNTAWLLHRGLCQHGEQDEADRLRQSALSVAARTDFAEYVEPYTGRGHGARAFAWTAALTLDLLQHGTGHGTGESGRPSGAG